MEFWYWMDLRGVGGWVLVYSNGMILVGHFGCMILGMIGIW